MLNNFPVSNPFLSAIFNNSLIGSLPGDNTNNNGLVGEESKNGPYINF